LGTTVVRALESAAREKRRLQTGWQSTRLFIQPGYSFQVVDSLITNFHLPRSTLLLLVSALRNPRNPAGCLPHGRARTLPFLLVRGRNVSAMTKLSFSISATDGRARASVIRTAHGVIETPIFMLWGRTAPSRPSAPTIARHRRPIIWATLFTCTSGPEKISWRTLADCMK
jgi:hypothetical protein